MTMMDEPINEQWVETLTDDYLDYFIGLKTRDVAYAKKSLANHKAFLSALKKEKARRAK